MTFNIGTKKILNTANNNNFGIKVHKPQVPTIKKLK
jgi:hypothetical protein